MVLTRIPTLALRALANVPDEFEDDGCSSAPDRLFGVDLSWACRIHDHWWCTRAHQEGHMTEAWRIAGDVFLGATIRQALSRHPLRAVAYAAYRWGPWFGRKGFDTCGSKPEGATPQQQLDGLCRHGLPKPAWMVRAERRAWHNDLATRIQAQLRKRLEVKGRK